MTSLVRSLVTSNRNRIYARILHLLKIVVAKSGESIYGMTDTLGHHSVH